MEVLALRVVSCRRQRKSEQRRFVVTKLGSLIEIVNNTQGMHVGHSTGCNQKALKIGEMVLFDAEDVRLV